MIDKQKQFEIEQRRLKVAANILAGLNYRDMAQALNVSIGTIASDAKAIYKQWQKEQADTVDKHVQIDLRRIDRMINALWDKVTADVPDLGSMDRVMRLMEMRARYLGAYKPTQIGVGDPEGKPLPAATTNVVLYIPDNGRDAVGLPEETEPTQPEG